MAGEDYGSTLMKLMEAIHDQVRGDMLGASDRIRQSYNATSEKWG